MQAEQEVAMLQQILIVQGGGEGAHAEDQLLADYLKNALGDQIDVLYPKFPGLESIDYAAWRIQALDILSAVQDDVIIVAHSLGGPALLKVLTDEAPACQIQALCLLAMPYKCTDGEWGTDEFALQTDFAQRLPPIRSVVLYHSRDDEWVPFDHLNRYKEKLPDAITVPLDGRGHSCMQQEFSELVEHIVQIENQPS